MIDIWRYMKGAVIKYGENYVGFGKNEKKDYNSKVAF